MGEIVQEMVQEGAEIFGIFPVISKGTPK